MIHRVTSIAALFALAPMLAGALVQDDPQPVEASTRFATLVERFHGVMPSDPTELRFAVVRERILPTAGPVLAELVEVSRRAGEASSAFFEVYGVVLGEPTCGANVVARAMEGIPAARAQLAAAATITAVDDAARCVAVDALSVHMREPDESQVEAIRAAEIAAALTPAELRYLAAAGDGPLAEAFRRRADREERSVRGRIGRALPLSGTTWTGDAWTSQEVAGRVLVVDFWATWCAPCVRALPDLAALRRAHGDDELAIVAVSCDQDLGSLRKFLAAHAEYDWPQLVAPELLEKGTHTAWHPLAVELGIDSIPSILVLDERGVLRWVGHPDGVAAVVEELLRE